MFNFTFQTNLKTIFIRFICFNSNMKKWQGILEQSFLSAVQWVSTNKYTKDVYSGMTSVKLSPALLTFSQNKYVIAFKFIGAVCLYLSKLISRIGLVKVEDRDMFMNFFMHSDILSTIITIIAFLFSIYILVNVSNRSYNALLYIIRGEFIVRKQ